MYMQGELFQSSGSTGSWTAEGCWLAENLAWSVSSFGSKATGLASWDFLQLAWEGVPPSGDRGPSTQYLVATSPVVAGPRCELARPSPSESH